MPVGSPDSADVRRHFFGRTVLNVSATLGANEFQGFSVAESNIDDVALVRIIADAGVLCELTTFGVSGDTAEDWELGLDQVWGAARRIVMQPMGGGISVAVTDTTGVAGKTFNFQVDTYIGADQNQMRINHRSNQERYAALAVAGVTPKLTLPEAQMYDAVALRLNANIAAVNLRAYTVVNDFGTASAMGTTVESVITSAAGAPSSSVIIPTTGIGMYFDVINLGAGVASGSLAFRAYRNG